MVFLANEKSMNFSLSWEPDLFAIKGTRRKKMPFLPFSQRDIMMFPSTHDSFAFGRCPVCTQKWKPDPGDPSAGLGLLACLHAGFF